MLTVFFTSGTCRNWHLAKPNLPANPSAKFLETSLITLSDYYKLRCSNDLKALMLWLRTERNFIGSNSDPPINSCALVSLPIKMG